MPGKLQGTLDSPLPTMRPLTRSQHTNFRGVRRIDFNVVVFTETATRTTVTSTTSRVLVEHRAMPWPTCSAARQNRQFGSRIFRQAAGRGTTRWPRWISTGLIKFTFFTELSTDPKAFLPSRIPALPSGVVVRTCSRQHLGSHHRNFTHTLHSPALHGCGWYRQFCSPFAAPQPSVCDGLSSPTSCCSDMKHGSWERSAECQSDEHDHHGDFHKGDFHVSFGCVRANQRFLYFTQTAFDCSHQDLNITLKSKTVRHFISSQPCDFFSPIEHRGICCSILCSQARGSSLDNSLKCLHRCPGTPLCQHDRSHSHTIVFGTQEDVSQSQRRRVQPGPLGHRTLLR